jgi:hypothetical protein
VTITPTKVRTQLAASSMVLESISGRLVAAVTNARLAMTDPIPDDRPKAEDAGMFKGKDGAAQKFVDSVGTDAYRDVQHVKALLAQLESKIKENYKPSDEIQEWRSQLALASSAVEVYRHGWQVCVCVPLFLVSGWTRIDHDHSMPPRAAAPAGRDALGGGAPAAGQGDMHGGGRGRLPGALQIQLPRPQVWERHG